MSSAVTLCGHLDPHDSDLMVKCICQGSQAGPFPVAPSRAEAERPLASSPGPGLLVLIIWRPLCEGRGVRGIHGRQNSQNPQYSTPLISQEAWGLGRGGSQPIHLQCVRALTLLSSL